MPMLSAAAAGGQNVRAFLDMLAWCEGTSISPATKNDGYDVIVTGVNGLPEVFTDYSDHPFAKGRPSKQINRKGLTSNASGRYQFMLKDWAHYKGQLGLPDFGPGSQDRWAIQLIREFRALDDVKAGRIRQAIARCAPLWASLPGSNQKDQRMRSLDDCIRVYRAAGGVMA
ncbi:glycoside hydrolase family 104 protein [Pseudomonas sp. QL9]|uniref:glycoside hydrolase family 24 protein n=1 Tax=Pseudomonas sp. QL9 TaxID=3242725 RepID=UPI00352B80AB